MASLHTHLTSPHHGRLSFNHRCPHCRQQRVLGTLATGPLVSLRARAVGALSVIAFAPALFATPAALAQNGPETSIGTGDPTPDGDNADDPNWSPPSVPNSKPLHDGGGVIDTDSPTNDGEGDPLDQDNDGDDPGAHGVAPPPPDPSAAPVPSDPAGSVVEDPVPDQPQPQPQPPAPPAAAPTPAAPTPAASPVSPSTPPAESKPATTRKRPGHARHRHDGHRRAARAPLGHSHAEISPARPGSNTASSEPREAVSGNAGTATTAARPNPAPVSGKSYTVRSGDSLWAIASRIAGPDASPARVAALVHELWSKNSSRIASGSPDMLAVGTVLELP